MISKFTLLSNLLLVSVALAAPSFQLEDHPARHDKIHQSQPLSRVSLSAPFPVEASPGWAGVVLADSNGSFSLVVGTFTVPAITGGDGSVSIWVGIDGNPACSQATFRTGIDVTVAQDQTYYQAWCEWYPGLSSSFLPVTISPGDVITATVAADNTTFGMAVIENRTTKQIVYEYFQGEPSTALCEASGEWIVEYYVEDSVMAPFANFNVTFTDVYAIGPSGTTRTVSDPDVSIVDIVQNNTIVAIDGDNIVIQYIGDSS